MMSKNQKNLLIGGAFVLLFLGFIVLRNQNNDEIADPAGDSLAAKIAHAPLTLNYSERFFKKNKPETTSRSFMLIGYDFNQSTTKTTADDNTPIQLNFVHRGDDDTLAVVGVTLTTGEHNSAFERVLNALTDDNVQATTDDLVALLPNEAPYTYPSDDVTKAIYGEGASWYKLDSSITVSAEQIAQLNAYYHTSLSGT